MTKSIFRTALFSSSALVAAVAFAAPAMAQGQPTACEPGNPNNDPNCVEPGGMDEQVTPETIVVTGSRIASPTVESAAPLQILNDQAIQDAGVTNVQDILLENPVFGTPALSRTNSAFLTSGTGVASVDLRDLGSDRTLVLINGRRVVAGLPGSSTVDLNVIPTQFLERVDILTGGASSLYGSDAVAGVVNFIYKQDFEGLDANIQYGITERGDDQRYQANLTTGANFSDGRGNIMAHVGYSNETGLLSRERSNTALDDSDNSVLTGDLADYGTITEPFFSSFPPQGRFIVGDVRNTFRRNTAGQFIDADDMVLDVQDPTAPGFAGIAVNESRQFTYDASGALRPCSATNGGTGPANGPFDSQIGNRGCEEFAGQAIGPDGFNRQAFRTLATPVKRFLFATRGSYEISDSINSFFEGTFSRTSASRIIEPFALESGGTTGIYPTAGVAPIENFVQSDQNGDGVVSPGEGSVVINPLIPDRIVAAATDQNGDGLRDYGFARRLTEFGPRSGTTERDFYRFVVGLDGQLFEDRFMWDLSYNFGQTLENQVSQGQVNVVNFRNALEARQDFDDENGNGSTDDVICIDAEARANGCVPINLFGAGAISPEAVAYIDAQGTYQTKITQQVVQGNLSGSLYDLPAGPLGVAVGFEYRKESSSEDNDSLTNQGLNAGNALPDTSGSFDVIEGFAEVRVPILADTPFFELLEVGGAVRVADYSTIGTIYSYSGTATWQPIDEVRLRGTYARAVRAPNIGELFSGLSQTFPSGLSDPCEGVGASGGGTLGDVCRSFPGVSANIAANGGAFALNQSDLQGISGFNGGNPDLQEETADSYTIGAVIAPRSIYALRNLTFTADYYNIQIDDVISGPPRAFTLDKCFNDGNQAFCDLVTRRPTDTAVNSAGSIEFINALQINAARLETEGLDLTANMFFNFDGLREGGRIYARGAYTHLFKYDYFPADGEPADAQDGEIGTADNRFTASVGFDSDLFRLGFTGTYIDSSNEDDQFCAAFGAEPGCVSVPAEFYLDMQASLAPAEQLELYFGVDNLLDNDAPGIYTNTTFNVTGSDTAADVYDIFGRRYYVGARFRF
ncbi:TonB-dependent receptor domain-containing protein [Pacificimonas sp. ICDLI1SI03]